MNQEIGTSRQVNNEPYKEFVSLKESLITQFGASNALLDQLSQDYENKMRSNNITSQEIVEEIEAKLVSKLTLSIKLIDMCLTQAIANHIKKIEQENRKRQAKQIGSKASTKKDKPVQIKIKGISFKPSVTYQESDKQLYQSSSFNSKPIELMLTSNDNDYKMIPKDELESYDGYKKYFIDFKKNLLSSYEIKEDDPLLDVNKFVLVVAFDTNEFKPRLEDLMGVDPSKDYLTYRLKMDNLDVNSMDYYFVSGSIMYFEGERKNNNEIIVKHYTSGFPFVTYSIQEEFLRHYYIESSPYLIYSMNGPFFSKDNYDLTVFKKTLQMIKNQNPHCLIINGPIIYSENEYIKNGDIVNENNAQITYHDLFDSFIKLIDEMFFIGGQTNTQVIITPSLSDELNYYPLPQPSYEVSTYVNSIVSQKQKKLYLLGNPQIFQMNEIIVGIANYDFIKDMSANCLRSRSKVPIDSALEMILYQHSLYPVLQNTITNEDADKFDRIITSDISKVNKFSFDTLPDIVLTTSATNPFIKKINATIFINSGPMFRGKNPGSIAKITTFPPSQYVGTEITKRVKVELLKIEVEAESNEIDLSEMQIDL